MTNKTNIGKVIRRIKKCLEMAKSNNANEAATALRQAQSLMEKYNITQTDIDLSDVSEEKRRAGVFRKPPRYLSALAQLICSAFGVQPIYKVEYVTSSYNLVTFISFIGVGIQPKIAAYSYEVLRHQIKKDRAAFLKTQKRFKRTNRIRRADSFCESWIAAVWDKVQALTLTGKQTALIKQYKESNYKRMVTAESRTHNYQAKDIEAALEGFKAGRNAYLNRGVDGNAEQGLLE